jgi:hypothetical protein
VEILEYRLKNAHGIELAPNSFERLYTGHHQRSSGAWSWMARDSKLFHAVGSQFSLTKLMGYKEWEVSRNKFGDTDIDPIYGSEI